MIYYFTFNDSYTGIYQSQVIDVVKQYQSNGIDIQLIAMVSPRSYFDDRKQIKSYLPNSIVLPSIPKLSNWKMNSFLLRLFTKKDSSVICRGVFATNIALLQKNLFRKLIYDGRGAIKAEQEEYGVYNGTGVEDEIIELERNAVLDSDYRISVSSKLIDYWKNEYNYDLNNHQIIPCSVGESFINTKIEKDYSLLPGLREDDILLIYSGSLAGWQSLDNLEEILEGFLKDKKVKVLFLSKEHSTISALINKFPNRVFNEWLNPTEVSKYLVLGDYGLLLRNSNWTNKVASPVKFAEYLSAGLKVLISENIGDFSELVMENNLGFVVKENINFEVNYINEFEKERIKKFARDNFSKKAVGNKYLVFID